MYFISGCKGTLFVLQGNVIHVTEMLQETFRSPFSTLQVFVESILRTYLFFLRTCRFPAVAQVVVHKACLALVRQLDGKHVRQLALQVRVQNGGYGFNAAVQVAAHPVGLAEKQFRLSAVAEVPHAGMFEEGVHNACDADVTAVFPSGDEAADASYDEVYLHPGL